MAARYFHHKTALLVRAIGCFFILASAISRAEIYECIDSGGSKRFTAIKSEAKGCKLLDIGPINTTPAPSPSRKAAPRKTPPRKDARTDVIDFKGVLFGASEKEFTGELSGYSCRTLSKESKRIGDRYCSVAGKPGMTSMPALSPAGTYAGVPANVSAFFYNDKFALADIKFFSDEFETVLGALTERYGQPDSLTREPVQTPMGATYENVKGKWQRREVILTVERFGSNVNESRVTYSTTWGLVEAERRNREQRKKGAGDV